MDKSELLQRVNNYVTHAKKVHEFTREQYKHTLEYGEKLENIQFIKTVLADLSLNNSKYQIAKTVYALRNRLKEILPNPMNDSYNSSFTNYCFFITECLLELNFAIGNQPGSNPDSEQNNN